ncbi:hypothetical protein [Salinarimonas chemoclinalis]|uniref:hypothetical protein n=1 Tax=Salinarimonas chemoclinalis TaxID=3241599 RepID=UPI003555BE8A
MIFRRTIEVPCTVEIENTFDSLHAHVDLHGVKVAPGDSVIVHGAPTVVPHGERQVFERRATVVRATIFDRLFAKAEGYAELTDLFEVGFEGHPPEIRESDGPARRAPAHDA